MNEEKPFRYYIYYRWQNQVTSGDGRIEMRRNVPIRSMVDIESIEQYIKDNWAAPHLPSHLIVVSWQRFDNEVLIDEQN